MAIVTLPTKQELFTKILSDATSKDELPNKAAWDEAIKYALNEYVDWTIEEIVEGESNIQDNLYGFVQGYLKGLER